MIIGFIPAIFEHDLTLLIAWRLCTVPSKERASIQVINKEKDYVLTVLLSGYFATIRALYVLLPMLPFLSFSILCHLISSLLEVREGLFIYWTSMKNRCDLICRSKVFLHATPSGPTTKGDVKDAIGSISALSFSSLSLTLTSNDGHLSPQIFEICTKTCAFCPLALDVSASTARIRNSEILH